MKVTRKNEIIFIFYIICGKNFVYTSLLEGGFSFLLFLFLFKKQKLQKINTNIALKCGHIFEVLPVKLYIVFL